MGKQIFVLGMHRSGTSVVTHLIHRMGAYFGDIDQEMRPSDENPKGFWERNDVVRINEAILNSDKSNWFKISNFDVERCRISPDLEQAIESTISSLDKYTPWVVKDPRNCLTFPVWRKYLSAPVVVIPFRSPLEVAKSLQGRNSFPVEFSLALWQSYVVAAIRSAADLPVIFVEYEKMIKSPIQETHTLYRKLVENGVENLELPSDLIIQDIIDPTLKHAAVSHEKEQLDQDKLNLIEGLREKDIDRLHRLVESISENNFRVLQNWEEKISEIFERTISKKNRITSTLFYSIEGEFSLKNSIRITQSTDEINKRLKFTIAPSFQPGQQIKVDLVDDICILQLTSISISGDGHTPIKEGAISSNAFYRMGEYFYFDQVPSSIYFSLPDDLDISSGNIEILINFELIGKGVTIIPHINQFHRNFVAYGEKTDDTGIDKIQELVQALTSQKDRALTKSQILLDYSKSSNQNLTENIQCLQEQNSAQLNLLDQLTAKLEKKEKEAEAFSKTSSELSKKLRIEKEARAELKNKYESVLSEKESQAGEIDQLSTLKVEHKSLIVQLEQELNDLKEEKQSTVVQLKREVDDLREEKQSLVVQLEQDVNNLRAEKQSAVAQLEQELAIIKDSLSNQLGRLLTFPVRIIFDVLTRKKPFNQTQLWWIKQHLTHPKAIIGSREKRQALRADWSLQRRATANNLSFSATTAEILSELDIEHDSSPDHTPVVPLMALNAKNKDNFRYRKKILYISPNLPDFDTSSGGKRATRMLELLAEVFDVYAFTLGSKPQKYIDELQRKGVIVLRTGDHREVRRKLPQIDTIIYAWYETYFSSTIFQHLYPNAKIIVDSVDVHWVREKRSIGLWEGLTEERVIANKKREIEAYRNADIIWAVTETDKAAIAAELPGTDIRVVSNIHEPMVHEYVDNHKHTLLFIGGYNHYPNVSAAKILAEQIFPKVQQSVQDATLIIAGANAPGEIEALSQIPGITFKGFIEEDEIKDLYAQSFLTVSPLLVGAGIKGKICESIAYMTPVVTNDIGNEGIYLIHEREGLISPVDQMSEWIIKALNREFDFEKITMGAQQKLSGLVGSKVVKERMVNSIVPEISICIVTWNRRDLVQRCIESIEGNTLYPNYKILVHSNGCADGTQDYLKAAAKINPKIIPILSEKNDVFVLPNNRMMEMYPENDVVLVNNDVYVTKGWLSALHDTAYSSADYGIVGSKILYPDGRLQEFGSE
ncbi:MAG: glycosyltransferase, partial [Lewinella sp.]|nr:glycosyltransferase [Lewinella sp.]